MSLKIRIRTLKNETFEISANPTDTTDDVKRTIEREKGHPAAHQKLIFNGVILADGKTLADSNVKENSFLVLMVKAPAAAAAAPTAAAAAPAPQQTPAPATAPAPSSPAAAAPPPKREKPDDGGVRPMDVGDDSVAAAESTLLTNQTQIDSTVAQLCEMGFPRDQVVKALRAAFNNPNRAVEYLMSGNIPDVPAGPAPGQQRPPAPAGGAGAGAGASAAAGGAGRPVNLFEAADRTRQGGGAAAGGADAGEGGENIFDFLRHNPQFNALRYMVQQNPMLLQPILGQLGQANPELLQLITQHQAEFTQLLNEPVDEADLPQGVPGAGGGAGGGGAGGPRHVRIELTQDEREAVERLMTMGFPQNAVLEAYVTCDKNEQLAANYLLEHYAGGGGEEEGFGFEEGDFDEEGGDDDEEGGGY